ncbi:MAG: type 3 dihydrofolate reductase [Minisyncoccota bacterium]
MISLIAAVDRNYLIGSGKSIPWYLPADFSYFKQTTLGHPVIMGRTTFESIGKPLPGRRNIVLSRGPMVVEGIEAVRSLEEAFHRTDDTVEVFVIGGASVYAQALPFAQKLYLTYIDGVFEGDIHFPTVDWNVWHETGHTVHIADERNAHAMQFVVYERVKNGSR